MSALQVQVFVVSDEQTEEGFRREERERAWHCKLRRRMTSTEGQLSRAIMESNRLHNLHQRTGSIAQYERELAINYRIRQLQARLDILQAQLDN